MILVFGANGRSGKLVVEALLAEGKHPRVMVRDAKTARQRFAERVDVFEGDLNNPAAIHAAAEGSSAIFLCSPVSPEQVKLQNAVVDAAALNNAYVVKLSGLATFPGSFVDSGRWHAETESYLANSGIPFTCLHPYFFMQNMDFQLRAIKEKGVLRGAVSEASIAMVDVRDIASVAARLLCDPTIAPGKTLPLTGNAALSYRQMAETMSEVFQRPVAFRAQTFEEVQANLSASGLPDWHAKIILQFNRAFAEGLGEAPHPAVHEILTREPISFEQYLRTTELNDAASSPFAS